jgi:DNA-binding MarR family transcriptional regulator
MPFDENIPISPLISILYRRQTSYLNKELRDVDLSYGLYPLLIKVYRLKEVSQEDLAKSLHLNESTVTRNLEKLEKKGLIVKTPEKRKKIISVTGKGAETAQKIMDYDGKWDEIIKENLSNEEFDAFKNTLKKICEELI